ncbi:hypothetical protein PILCRDRAFT_8503 [Piloderma croceum F 1598]|uniref:Protein ZIP4 homolog n=1 Tax=Piloderma croceum (strain F 1598) TaxID=765440 RepID=A0A0C3B6I6_PILCF|nr:hypothetical protein PILCRDRAFT_8503 [Piloderma croceum F 1598]
MSAHKLGASSAILQDSFDSIKGTRSLDLLVKIKPKLNDAQLESGPLVHDLYQVAALAESFTAQRPKSNKNWGHLADALDREGVTLWNTSGLIRQGTDTDNATVVAALRLAGFRLVEAGLEKSPGIEKAVIWRVSAPPRVADGKQSWSNIIGFAPRFHETEIGNKDRAASILTSAAKLEESLRNTDDPQGLHQQPKARATIVYYSSRMEAAWREGNDGVANFMLQKITEHERLAQLPLGDRELLAAKLLEIGKSVLKASSGQANSTGDGVKAQDAVRWMQKAYYMIEQLDDSATPGIVELKRAILRSLARAYFISSSHDLENLTRAETALQELIASIDTSADPESAEYQQLRWMRLAVLKRRKAGDPEVLVAFKSIIDHMRFTEADVTDILQELRTLSSRHRLVSAVNIHCLRRALSSHDNSGLVFVDRLLLSSIFHCSKDDDHVTAMDDLKAAFNCILEAEFELSRISTTACLTLIWQYGDRHYHVKKWTEAADWFRSGSHQVFKNMGSSNVSKCLRKAALCHVQQREYAKAASDIRLCANSEATTHYMTLLIAVHQGLEDEAIKAARDMARAPDFDRKMLILATQLAHESDMKGLLLSVLDALLQTSNIPEGNMVTEAMVLIRCAIRLILKLMTEPAANQPILIGTLVEHFRTAKRLIEAACAEQKSTLVMKDVSWLWRTAYNCAIQGCSEWKDAEAQATELFEISRELITVYCNVALVEVDVDVYLHAVKASFAATSGRVFAVRHLLHNGSLKGQNGQLQVIAADIQSCKERILDIMNKFEIRAEEDVSRVRSFVHVLRIFETEMICHLKDWDAMKHTIAEAIRSDTLAVITFEAIADILWTEKDCPVDVLFAALEALLHASLDRSCLSVEKFSRWLRAICTILLSRNGTADRVKALGYVEQSFAVMDTSGGDPADTNAFYPMDERQWLLGTSYNTGIECLQFVLFLCMDFKALLKLAFHSASLLDEARRWFESSTVICKFVPDGENRAQKISKTYTHLLARYTPCG